jgi:YD repeat-containing protein
VDLLSQNAHWGQPLINLKGRAGLDLNLSLVYNSLVWTRAGSQIAFDPDRGQPSPGFRLGFPTIQPRYRDTQTGKFTYPLLTPEGKRVELRQVGERSVYESVDNSLLQMIDNGASGALLLRPDGTRLSFKWLGGQLQCIEVQDRNGNYIRSDYDKRGHLKSITDTVGRTFLFIRDNGGNLVSIRQKSSGSENRVLATFGYSDLVVQTNYSGLKVVVPTNGSTITVLTQLGVPDGSRYQFDYTSWGQVWRVTKYAPDDHVLSYVSYNLPQDAGSALADTPRPTKMRNWAEGANNGSEAVTRYAFDPNSSSGQVTLPDGSVHKEFFGTEGWQRGLATEAEDSAGGTLQRRTVTEWIQDDQSLKYGSNPRQREVNVYYSLGNKQRTSMEYTAYGLVSDVYRYSAKETTPIQHTHFEYDLDSAYTNRHIIGLVKEQAVYGVDGTLTSKTTYDRDLNKVVDQGPVVGHDNINYGADSQTARGLVSTVRGWSAKRPNKSAEEVTTYTYNTTGSVIVEHNSEGRETEISYADNFADGSDHRAFAFPTTRTDSKGYRKLTEYDYDTGAEVQTQDAHGTVKTFAYDAAGRRTATTNQATGATARAIYDESGTLAATFIRMRPNLKEIGSYVVYDGFGRLRARAIQTNIFRGVSITRDAMGRTIGATKVTKMTSAWEATEPLALLNSSGVQTQQVVSQSLAANIRQFGQQLIRGADDFISVVQPTVQAQDVAPLEGDDGGYCPDDGIGTWLDGGDGYQHYTGDYDGAYSADLGASWNAAGQYWDFGGDQTPVQVIDASDSSVGDQLMIAGGLVLVLGGPEEPVGDVAAGGYLAYEWLIIGTGILAAGSSEVAQTGTPTYPPVPWDDPSRSPGTEWEWRGPGTPGSEEGAWYNPGTTESLHPDLNHAPPIGPHWDYSNPANNGPNGRGWRAYPDGRLEPK